jgi:TolA-binding protein
MQISRLLWIGIGTALIQAGCFSAASKEVNAEYARQVTVASARAAQVEQHLANTESRLKNLEQVLRNQGQAEAERLENIDQVNSEISRLRGQIEEMGFVIQDLKVLYEQATLDQERRQLHDEARLSQLEGFLGITPPPPPILDDVSTGDPSTVETNPDGVESPDQGLESFPADAPGKLELAMKHIEAERPALARVILQKAIEEHAGAPELAEIRYRIAQSWFQEKKWTKAIGAFESVNTHHRKSEWAAWAMLGQGECFVEMGQGDNGKLFYAEVIRQYPKSEAAKEAKKRNKE